MIQTNTLYGTFDIKVQGKSFRAKNLVTDDGLDHLLSFVGNENNQSFLTWAGIYHSDIAPSETENEIPDDAVFTGVGSADNLGGLNGNNFKGGVGIGFSTPVSIGLGRVNAPINRIAIGWEVITEEGTKERKIFAIAAIADPITDAEFILSGYDKILLAYNLYIPIDLTQSKVTEIRYMREYQPQDITTGRQFTPFPGLPGFIYLRETLTDPANPIPDDYVCFKLHPYVKGSFQRIVDIVGSAKNHGPYPTIDTLIEIPVGPFLFRRRSSYNTDGVPSKSNMVLSFDRVSFDESINNDSLTLITRNDVYTSEGQGKMSLEFTPNVTDTIWTLIVVGDSIPLVSYGGYVSSGNKLRLSALAQNWKIVSPYTHKGISWANGLDFDVYSISKRGVKKQLTLKSPDFITPTIEDLTWSPDRTTLTGTTERGVTVIAGLSDPDLPLSLPDKYDGDWGPDRDNFVSEGVIRIVGTVTDHPTDAFKSIFTVVFDRPILNDHIFSIMIKDLASNKFITHMSGNLLRGASNMWQNLYTSNHVSPGWETLNFNYTITGSSN